MNESFKFDQTFQTKIISSMFIDKVFFLTVIDSIKVEYFTVEALRWTFEVIRQYYKEYKNLPTLDVIKNEVKSAENEALRISLIQGLPKMVEYFEAKDLNYVKDQTRFFCKKQAVEIEVRKISGDLNKITDFLDFESIKRKLDTAFMVGEDTASGVNYVDNVKQRYSPEGKRQVIPTGFGIIDKLNLGGGLAPGELGVVIAGSGIGKSWVLTMIGLNALKLGKNVVHYTLELDEAYTSKRYDACLLHMDQETIEQNLDLLEQKTKELKGELRIRHFTAKSVSLTGIKANIEKGIMLGFTPDLIIIDYPDLISTPGNGDKRSSLEDLYIDMRAMADELRIPTWVASQTNRSGYNSDVAKGGDVSESFGKLFTGDFVMSFNRSDDDKAFNRGKFHVIKSRFGDDGTTYICNVELKRGIIEAYEAGSPKAQEIELVMNNQPKQKLKEEYMNFKKTDKKTLDF